MKAEQPSLFILKPKPPTAFELESRRRGAPFMVAGRRWRMEKARNAANAVQRLEEAPQRPTVASRGLRRIGDILK